VSHVIGFGTPAAALEPKLCFSEIVDMIDVALWEPEIPPNTGNIARLCAATGAELHLIGRLGFRLDDRSLRRAGLDYWRDVHVTHHPTLQDFETA
jgi:tRNA (cytidine/uridine-2'-O-)-methyltransferase